LLFFFFHFLFLFIFLISIVRIPLRTLAVWAR